MNRHQALGVLRVLRQIRWTLTTSRDRVDMGAKRNVYQHRSSCCSCVHTPLHACVCVCVCFFMPIVRPLCARCVRLMSFVCVLMYELLR